MRMLVEVGDRSDLALLRSIACTHRRPRELAVALARRLAPKVLVEDLGAVRVTLGGRPLERNLRRKVLGLLCFLVSRHQLAATRDEALEALWPDLAPDAGANSLHQTIYFLRRVFEPDFKEGLGAGYISFDGEVVSLSPDFIDASSRRCWRLLSEGRRLGIDYASELMSGYSGRFAQDFAYEEWAVDYRDHLHAAVLAAVEASINEALAQGVPERAIDLAQRVLTVDSTADTVELALLKAYKASRRHAAAAEQYAHYASQMREQLGIEAPPIEEL